MTTPVQYIACINHAGFYMNFGLEVFIPQNANTPNVPQGIFMVQGVSTDDYAIGETRVLDLSNAPPVLPEGILVRPRVNPLLGLIHIGDKWVQYGKNGQTAFYEVTGTTFIYTVILTDADTFGITIG
jgi:hypothetical protein